MCFCLAAGPKGYVPPATVSRSEHSTGVKQRTDWCDHVTAALADRSVHVRQACLRSQPRAVSDPHQTNIHVFCGNWWSLKHLNMWVICPLKCGKVQIFANDSNTSQLNTHEQINMTSDLGNACYHAGQNIFSSCLLSKNLTDLYSSVLSLIYPNIWRRVDL
jgi:hypothetical protein